MGSTTTLYPPELAENMRRAELLVRNMTAQSEAERKSFEQGWNACVDAMFAHSVQMYEAGWNDGYEASEVEMDAAWAETARKVRELGSPSYRSFAEKRAEEMGSLADKPTDFPGTDNDPDCLKPYYESLEEWARNRRAQKGMEK